MREKRFGKRCLTWVLIMMMTLSLLPVGALAADGEELDENATLHSAIFTSTDARDTDSENEFEEQGDENDNDVIVNAAADDEEENKSSDDTESDDADDNETIKYDISKSKTATQLNKSMWTSEVTLSLPSAEENLATDVVLVLDASKCTKDMLEAAINLLDALETQAKDGANIKVGVVMFKGNAVPFLNLAEGTDLQALKDSFTNLIQSDDEDGKKTKDAVREYVAKNYPDFMNFGTNLPAGLLLAKKMLDEDKVVSAERKYMLLVSDGSTYLFTHGQDYGTAYSRHYVDNADSQRGGLYENNHRAIRFRISESSVASDWVKWLKSVEEFSDTFTDEYDYKWNGVSTECPKPIPSELKDYLINSDTSVYQSAELYKQMKALKYNCYYCYIYDTEDYYGRNMLKALNDDAHLIDAANIAGTDAFSGITKDIIYAVSAGSTVEDKIGEKFTFGGVDSFVLTVGGEKIEGVVDENTVNFGEKKSDGQYPYTVTYSSDTKTFVWTINEDVSNFAPVQLSYTVKLTKPETDYGTYGVTDLDGDEYVDGTDSEPVNQEKALYTNESAILIPKNSAGIFGNPEEFPKPSVSYTVSRPHHPSKPDNTVEIPDEDALGLNTDDHFAYIIGYPDGTVQPNGQITRAEATTIFFRLLTDESRDANLTKTNRYADVAADAWYNTAVSTMTKAGIVDGYPDGTFRPDAPITRAEMAKIVSLFAQLDKSESRFTDIAGHWAEKYIALAAGNGWIAGYPDGTFGPQRNITRAETATMINRVLDRVPSEESHLLSRGVMQVWPDSNPGDWFYLAMQEATNSHDYERNAKWAAADEQWTALRETRDWKVLEQ